MTPEKGLQKRRRDGRGMTEYKGATRRDDIGMPEYKGERRRRTSVAGAASGGGRNGAAATAS